MGGRRDVDAPVTSEDDRLYAQFTAMSLRRRIVENRQSGLLNIDTGPHIATVGTAYADEALGQDADDARAQQERLDACAYRPAYG